MCYGTRIVRKAEQLEFYFDIERALGEMTPNTELVYNHANGWAHPNMWILPQQKKGFMIPAKWGLMPSSAIGKDYKDYFAKNRGAFGGLNSRAGNLFSVPLYRDSIITRRCVIPVDGFFEPHTTSVKVKGKPYKVPFYFTRKDGGPINLAGIYTITADKMVTFSVITREATPLFEMIHNQPSNKYGDFRRPVVLEDNEVAYWLQDDHNAAYINDIIDNDLPDHEFDTWPISKDLNKRNGEDDRPDIIEKVAYDEIEIRY